MLIIKKLIFFFKICVDYKTLNAIIIKNYNVLFLIRETLTQLYLTKIYNKFDIIVVFNKIRMKKSNEHKIAFLTRYKLFKYVIMLFELCNTSNTFQIFINSTFKKYLNDFCINYLNNILIYSDNKKKI